MDGKRVAVRSWAAGGIGLILILSGLVHAAGPISGLTTELREGVRAQLRGQTTATTLLSNAVVDWAINRGLSQTCADFPAYEKLDTVTVSKSGEGAALPSDFVEVKAVYRMIGDTMRFPLMYLPPDTIASHEASNVLGEQGTEVNAANSLPYYHTHAGRLLFHPKSKATKNDTMLVEYYAMDAPLDDSTDTAHVEAKYMEKVILYACWALSVTQGDGRAAAYLAAYAEGMPPKPWRKNPEER
jgi:hypothetical protein